MTKATPPPTSATIPHRARRGRRRRSSSTPRGGKEPATRRPALKGQSRSHFSEIKTKPWKLNVSSLIQTWLQQQQIVVLQRCSQRWIQRWIQKWRPWVREPSGRLISGQETRLPVCPHASNRGTALPKASLLSLLELLMFDKLLLHYRFTHLFCVLQPSLLIDTLFVHCLYIDVKSVLYCL